MSYIDDAELLADLALVAKAMFADHEDRAAQAFDRITAHIEELTKCRARLTELEQRLARVAELAHDRDGDTLEARSQRLGQCAQVSWDHMEESFSDDPLKKRSTLKWAHLAAQLSDAEQRIEALKRELESYAADSQKRLREDAISSLRYAPISLDALDANGRTYNTVGSGLCSHGKSLLADCEECETIVTERMAKIAARRKL